MAKSKTTRARRAHVNLSYSRLEKKTLHLLAGKEDYQDDIRKFLESFSCTACASGEADRIEVTLQNCDGRFFKKWRPRKKDKLTAKIVMKDWKKGQAKKVFNCGTFLIESFSGSGPPMSFSINATSVPESSSFRATVRDKSWKKAKLKEVARKIANRYHMKLVFDGEDFSIGTVEQSGETDCSFLTNLCEEYAYGIKIFKGKIIIYSKEKYEKKPVAGTIYKRMMADFNFESNLCGTYTGAKMKYTDSDTDKEVTVKVGKGNRWLTVSGDANSTAQAKRKAKAALRNQNEQANIFNCTIRGNTRYHETDTVKIYGFGRVSGKYFIDQVVHSIDGQGGFTTSLTMHRVLTREQIKVIHVLEEPLELVVKGVLGKG